MARGGQEPVSGAEEYRARVEALAEEGPSVEDEVAALVAMLGEADDGGGGDALEAMGPVVDRLVALGPAAADALVSTHAPGDSYCSDLVAEVLYRVAVSGPGEDPLGAILDYFLENADAASTAFYDRAVRTLSRAGAMAAPRLLDHLRAAEDPHPAALLVRTVLEDSDPTWAAEASHRMLGTLLEEDRLGLADLLSPGVAAACGEPALPTIREVARRKGEGGYDKTLLFQADVYDALEMLGEDPRAYGLDPYDPITRHFNTLMFGPDESKWGAATDTGPAGSEDDDALPSLDLMALRRHDRADLAVWCDELDLGTGGSKDELVERLEAYREEEFPPVELLSGVEVRAMRPKRMRELLDRYDLVTHGKRGELEERLLWLFDNLRRDLGPPPAASREDLEASEPPVLVDICRNWDLDPRGGPDELVDRILEAQDAHAAGRRPWPPGGSGEGIVPPGTFDEGGGPFDL